MNLEKKAQPCNGSLGGGLSAPSWVQNFPVYTFCYLHSPLLTNITERGQWNGVYSTPYCQEDIKWFWMFLFLFLSIKSIPRYSVLTVMVPEWMKTSSAHKDKTPWKERWVLSTDYKASQNETHHNYPSFIIQEIKHNTLPVWEYTQATNLSFDLNRFFHFYVNIKMIRTNPDSSN